MTQNNLTYSNLVLKIGKYCQPIKKIKVVFREIERGNCLKIILKCVHQISQIAPSENFILMLGRQTEIFPMTFKKNRTVLKSGVTWTNDSIQLYIISQNKLKLKYVRM